jgi:hypothetical protein
MALFAARRSLVVSESRSIWVDSLFTLMVLALSTTTYGWCVRRMRTKLAGRSVLCTFLSRHYPSCSSSLLCCPVRLSLWLLRTRGAH